MNLTNHYLYLLVLELVLSSICLVPTLVSVDVMARYLLVREKFIKDLKVITLEDH